MDKDFFLSTPGRVLLGGIIGLILGIIPGSYYGFEYTLMLIIACGLAGLISYPHKKSIIFLISGFFVVGFLISPDLYYLEDFVIGGGLFGIPAGALLSRVLLRSTVLK